MRFETFEPRIVFDQSLGPAAEIAINHPVVAQSELPSNIQFRSTAEDFHYSSEGTDAATVDALITATESWAEDPIPIYSFPLDDHNLWRKQYNFNPISVHPSGHIVAERVAGQLDAHTMLAIQKPHSPCHMLSGTLMRPNHHYRFSFDVRHPTTELSWLTTIHGHWSIVTQIWGPDTAGTGLNPPFSIHTSVQNGVPYWAIASRGDANAETIRPYDEERFQYVPMDNVGAWHHWDIEYVPSHQGTGLARVWLNGELVADWVDIKSSFLAIDNNNEVVGPLNPLIGLYSNDIADGQQAHFDNITLQCSGIYESSISGRVTGTVNLAGNTVYATNDDTGARYGVTTGDSGVYTLELPRGNYTVTAVNQDSGYQSFVDNVSTFDFRSQVVDIDVTTVFAPPPTVIQTLSGDVTGDGVSDIVHFLEDGTWHVSRVDAQGNVSGHVWTTWDVGTTWKDPMLGDFNGDGKQDVIARAENGNWWVGLSTGSSFRDVLWAKWTPWIDWLDVAVGDFNGDSKSDVVGRAATNGSWWVGESTGTGFSNNSWGRWSTSVPWDVVVGDFNGDGLSDIAGRAANDGTLWVGASTGSRFLNMYWGRFSSRVPWSDLMVGDFNADGRSDLVARVPTDGTWWVAESQGDKFFHRYFGRWNTATRWTDLQVADVNGDGRSDVVGRALAGNSWWIGRSTGDIFQNLYWGTNWSRNVDWLVAIADDFDGDDQADLLGGSSSRWWLFR